MKIKDNNILKILVVIVQKVLARYMSLMCPIVRLKCAFDKEIRLIQEHGVQSLYSIAEDWRLSNSLCFTAARMDNLAGEGVSRLVEKYPSLHQSPKEVGVKGLHLRNAAGSLLH